MTCPNFPKTDAQVVLDPEGDLCLRVGTTGCIGTDDGHGHRRATIFVCDSRTLSRASAVWKSNLNGSWSETHNRSQGDWVVELPDENVEPMATILDIIHLRFETLHADKAEESIPPLYELVILAEKYDLTKVLRPWAKAWLQPLRDQYSNGLLVRKIDDPVALHKQLYIAWELGDQFLVGKTLEDMVFHLKDWQFDGRGPPGLVGNGEQLFFWNNFGKYFDNVSNYKPPDPGLKVIGGRKVPVAQSGRSILHEECHPVPKGYDYIEKACSEIVIELEDSHIHYIQSQAAKTGIEVVELEDFHLKHLRSQAAKTGIEPNVSAAQSTAPKGARKRSRMFSSDSEFD